MAVLHFVGILLIVVNVFGQKTDYNCFQRPPISSDLKNCCKRPTLSVNKYKALCYNGTASGAISDRHAFMNPCGIECMYTQAGALSGTVFNMPKTRAFLREIMPNDLELASIMYAGFQTCAPDTLAKMQEFEANRPVDAQGQPIQFPGQSCSPFAVITTFCAMRYTFINCPSDLWTNSDICNKAQEFVKNCDPMQFGGMRNRAGRKRRGFFIPKN